MSITWMAIRCILIIGLIIASVYDIKTLQFPLWIPSFLLIFSLFSLFVPVTDRTLSSCVRQMIISLFPLVVICLMHRLNIEIIGKGDGLLLVDIGLITGADEYIFIILIALVLAGVVSAVLLVFRIKGQKDKLPFIPFLTIGTIATSILK